MTQVDLTLVLEGGTVIDGTGLNPPQHADVLVRGNQVEAVVARPPSGPGYDRIAEAGNRLDCSGALVVPGFIDIHTHSDLTWLSAPDCASRVTQGITTEVIGNCGMSPAPRDAGDPDFRRSISVIDQDPDVPLGFTSFEEYLDQLAHHRAAVDVLPMVGHGSARQTAMFKGTCFPDGVATLVGEALDAGAWGTSLGLMYPPGEAASPEELSAVAEITAAKEALLAVHLRAYEANRIERALEEMFELQARTTVSLEVSHLRAIRAPNPDVVDRCLRQLELAGPKVNADAYPYTAGQTTLFQLLLPEDRQRGASDFMAAAVRRRAHFAHSFEASQFNPEDILLVRTNAPQHAEMIGSTLADISRAVRLPWPEVAVDLLWQSGCYVDVVVFGSNPCEQERILAHPRVMVGSDGFSMSTTYQAAVHPRAFGAFPRALRTLVDGGMSWERAIPKVTSMPAAKIGIRDRGVLQANLRADITVFEPDKLADCATYDRPLVPSSGLRHVIVAGVPVLRDGHPTGARPGRVVLRP